MLKNDISALPVVDNKGNLEGIITKGDVFRAMATISGIYQAPLQLGLELEDQPGSINEVTEVIRAHGGRIVSIINTYHQAPENRARGILTAERTALNFLQRMSGIATLTHRYVETVKGTRAVILDTRKTAPGRTEAYKLMGTYFWLIGKQRKALAWWKRSIKEGERLGARPELCRTYMEVGKRLMESQSKYRELNGLGGEDYLNKARTMFQDMGLQWDLDELERIPAAN